MNNAIDDLLNIPQEILITLVHDMAVNGFDITNGGGVTTVYKFEEVIKEMQSESELYWIPWEETQAFKNFKRAIKREVAGEEK